MAQVTCLRINTPDVVSETIEGETVIINLYKGLYYNLNSSGSFIWSLIEAGTVVEKIVDAMQSRYPALSQTEQDTVHQLIDQLQAEELVKIVHSQVDETEVDPTAQVAESQAFEAPILYKYADMQDLLALDPIHDVDATGWPNQPAQTIGSGNF
jgi:hypothetical protein